ncbi:MAG: hypothetical protein D6675_14965 [Gemmatimonadetes bacterium]|nr:MAG: hypothetical protein D6675_14965 [Gemmatimonadota bacterium]
MPETAYQHLIATLDASLERILQAFFAEDPRRVSFDVETWMSQMNSVAQSYVAPVQKLMRLQHLLDDAGEQFQSGELPLPVLQRLMQLLTDLRTSRFSGEFYHAIQTGEVQAEQIDHLLNGIFRFIILHTPETELLIPGEKGQWQQVVLHKGEIHPEDHEKEFLSYLLTYQIDALLHRYHEQDRLYDIANEHLHVLEERYSREDELFVGMMIYYLQLRHQPVDDLIRRFKAIRQAQPDFIDF